MSVRLFALVSAVSLSALATAAPAQDPRGSHVAATAVGMSYYSYDSANRNSSCRNHAFQCGIRAYDSLGPQSGIAWFRQAARQGSAPAMRSLGLIYLRGDRGVRANPQEALGWFYEAALRQDATSMFALGRAFQDGVGVGRDPQLARFWIERAAAKGYGPARRVLRDWQ